MKTRIITAAVALPLLLVILFFTPLIVFGCVAGLVAAIAAYEFLRCTEPELSRSTLIIAALLAAMQTTGAAYTQSNVISHSALFLLMLFVFMDLIFSFRNEEPVTLESVMSVIFAAGIVPYMLSSLVRLGAGESGGVYILLPLIITMTCDSGAYFAGVTLGRHKLAPQVSPNKTIEGATGGFVCGTLCCMLYGGILKFAGFEANFILLACYGFLGSLVSQIGDLAFSAVKRIVGIKDYGNLIPGHGGALDRFDSIIFVAPLVEILMLWVPAIWKLG